MNPLRQQLPVHSPLPWRAVLASLARRDDTAAVSSALGTMYDATRVLLTDSGTSALALALRLAVARKGGGHCLLPGFGCYDLVTAALAADVRVALYDVEPETLAPRLDSVAALMRDECAAIVVVHHYGVTTALDGVTALATRVGAVVVEDAAQAAGARWAGRRAGAGADAAILSFGRGKGVTGGDGGALLLSGAMVEPFEDSTSAVIARAAGGPLLPFAKLLAQWSLARPAWYGIPARLPFLKLGETVFRSPHPVRAMHPASVRVLRHTLSLMDTEAAVRSRNAERLRAQQQRLLPATSIRVSADSSPGWLRLPVRLPLDLRIDEATAARLGVRRSYPRPLGTLDEIRRSLTDDPDTPGAADLCARLWTLPTHSALEEPDLTGLERWLAELGTASRSAASGAR